jgi:uncharacterized protein YqjF (DUF2071 family)
VFIISNTEHRPWSLPAKPWIMKQSWHDLLFAHWPIPIKMIRNMVPSPLDIDLYEGTAWIGVVPFHMSNIRLRGLPTIPFTSKFPEINVRTYVTYDNKPGVYFFSLDAANLLAVIGARLSYKLPYFLSSISVEHKNETVYYESKRSSKSKLNYDFKGEYGPISSPFKAKSDSLEYWLSERYCLYTVSGKNVYRCDIHHQPWPLQLAKASISKNTLATNQGLTISNYPTLLHFSKRLDVLIWPLEKINSSSGGIL